MVDFKVPYILIRKVNLFATHMVSPQWIYLVERKQRETWLSEVNVPRCCGRQKQRKWYLISKVYVLFSIKTLNKEKATFRYFSRLSGHRTVVLEDFGDDLFHNKVSDKGTKPRWRTVFQLVDCWLP